LLYQQNKPAVEVKWEAGWTPERFWPFDEKKHLLLLPEIDS
jgi:hypothetical protein